jgi:imidazolonepropionase-like amidohydrolase
MTGKTILPGLINTHGHVTVDDNTRLPMREHMLQVLKAYSDYGVTAVVSLGSSDLASEAEGFRIRDEQRAGTPDRTRLITAGMNAIGKTPAEARASVARLQSVKADLIKYHINGTPTDMTPEIYGALVDEAKKRGFMTTVHIFYLKDAKLAIEKGTNALVHSVRDQDVDRPLIDMMKRNNVAYVPTLTRDLSVVHLRNGARILAGAVLQEGPLPLSDRSGHPEGPKAPDGDPQQQQGRPEHQEGVGAGPIRT